jgi:hypothetical protein
MSTIRPSLLTLCCLVLNIFTLQGEDTSPSSSPSPVGVHKKHPQTVSFFEPFTGKVLKNKVRLRLQPSFEGAILREFNRNDLVIAVGELDDFYAVEPPADMKAFVFRTYILDHVVEGSNVNVRLKPDLEAPVVAQLHSGDRIEGGIIDPNHPKWLQIKIPTNVQFYIAKDYIEKVGDKHFMTRLEKKREEVSRLLSTTEEMHKNEMHKPFDQVGIEGIKANYAQIIHHYTEFPELGERAKERLAALQEEYTAKKLAHLENQSRASSSTQEVNKKLAAELQVHKTKLALLEKQLGKQHHLASTTPTVPPEKPQQLPVNMVTWVPVEEDLLKNWVKEGGLNNPEDFYGEQKKEAFVLRGMIDAYHRPVKNKPGDFMLVNPSSKLPIAFLYSTCVNLQEYVGREVSVLVSPRSNNNFAFPAYFVFNIE